MAAVNLVMMQGNVGNDVTLRHLENGRSVTDINLAVTRRFSVGQGEEREQREETVWMRITAWGALAENVARWVTKGQNVTVIGRLAPASAFLTAEGEPRATIEITASDIQFGQRPTGAGGAPAQEFADEVLPF